MKLYCAAASPFARKVLMAAFELRMTRRIELVEQHVTPGMENADYAADVNPLRKIPSLKTDDGMVLFDSSVICEYLDAEDGGHRLFPAAAPLCWQVHTAHSVANGVMDAVLLLRYETFLRPEPQRWALWIDEQWEKIANGLGWFEARSPGTEMTIDQIALACALGYLDFRFDDFAWRDRFSNLSGWHAAISTRESYSRTMPAA